MKTKQGRRWRVWLCGAVALGFTGCAGVMTGRQYSQGTSVMQFLYPQDAGHVAEPTIPELALPLRVGVAFVPPGDGRSGGYSHNLTATITPTQQAALIETVAARFRDLPYVAEIKTVPAAYLRPGGSFANLDQVRSMFGVDVIALVAYDQVQFTDENFLSLSYWTIVGAYVVRGEKNDTQTLLDATVYDIASRSLLFRAPGTSQVKASATPIGQEGALREDREEGLRLAAVDMAKNLETELAAFKTRLKERPDTVRVTHRPGYSGAGAFEAGWALALAGGLVWATRKKIMSRRGATFSFGTLAIAGAAAFATAFPALADALAGERHALAAGQVWRLWTAHLAHFSGGHWVWSTLVWLAAGAWLERENRAAWWRVVLIGAPLITAAALLGDEAMARYGGLSGLACAPLVWAGWRLLREQDSTRRAVGGAILLGLVWKVTREWTNTTPLLAEFAAEAGEVRTAFWAHFAGALVGAWAARFSRDEHSDVPAKNVVGE